MADQERNLEFDEMVIAHLMRVIAEVKESGAIAVSYVVVQADGIMSDYKAAPYPYAAHILAGEMGIQHTQINRQINEYQAKVASEPDSE